MPEVSAADALLARIAALQCGTTFNTEFGAINDDVTALALAGDPRANEVSGARTDRVEELNFCVVTPTVDDGSVPITSGGQVSVVPEGSAETGEA